MVVEVLITSFFCCFGVPWEVHSDQGCNFESRLTQEVLQCLKMSKMHMTPQHPQLDSMAVCYIKMVKEHIRKVVASHKRDWDARLPIFLLAYRASTHDTTGSIPPSLVFGRELRLPCNLMFGAHPNK
jgi:hypothetical protein